MNTTASHAGLPLPERVVRYRFPVAPDTVAEVTFVGRNPTADAFAITIATLQVMERAKRSGEEAMAPKTVP